MNMKSKAPAALMSSQVGKNALLAAGLGRLVARAELYDAELGEQAEHAMPFLLGYRSRLLELGATTAEADVIETLARRLDPAQHGSVETVLLRALAPRIAILTTPREHLFRPEELEDLAQMRRVDTVGQVPTIDLRQKVGRTMDYSGYLCVILKVTRLCNLRCVYCKDWSADPSSIAPLVLLADLTAQLLGGRWGGVDLVLHGGEPMMIGRRRFLQLVWLIAYHAREGQVVRLHMQSNATLITDRWLRLLQLFYVPMSVSLDGPAMIHDAQRPDTQGRPTSTRVLDGMRGLDQAGLLSGVLIVVSRSILDLGAEMLVEFLEAQGIRSVCLIPERPGPSETPDVGASAFVQFLIAVEEARQRRPNSRLAIREIDAVRRLLDGEASGFCELAGGCVGHFVTVDANGDVSHCDKYVGDATYTLGNLYERSLDSILTGERVKAIRNAAEKAAPAPGACRFRSLCQGWCPHERYVAGQQATDCCGLEPLFDALERETTSQGSSQ